MAGTASTADPGTGAGSRRPTETSRARAREALGRPEDYMQRVRERFRVAMGARTRGLRSRNFRLFFIGQLISNSGNWLTMVALTLLVLHLTGSGVSVGLVAACQFGPILMLSPFAGLRRRPLQQAPAAQGHPNRRDGPVSRPS